MFMDAPLHFHWENGELVYIYGQTCCCEFFFVWDNCALIFVYLCRGMMFQYVFLVKPNGNC